MVADNVRDNGCLPFHLFLLSPARGNGPILRKILARSLYLTVIACTESFLGEEVNLNGSNNIVAVGIAVRLVLFALGFILRQEFEVYAGRRTKESDVE